VKPPLWFSLCGVTALGTIPASPTHPRPARPSALCWQPDRPPPPIHTKASTSHPNPIRSPARSVNTPTHPPIHPSIHPSIHPISSLPPSLFSPFPLLPPVPGPLTFHSIFFALNVNLLRMLTFVLVPLASYHLTLPSLPHPPCAHLSLRLPVSPPPSSPSLPPARLPAPLPPCTLQRISNGPLPHSALQRPGGQSQGPN
jgi:hypothetical protein